MIYSISETAKLNEFRPYYYFKYILTEIPKHCAEKGNMSWTKGHHAFIVATHVDKAHIHNHIIYNSTNLECDRKWRDFLRSGKALQKVSDMICIEHGLSTIEQRP